MYCTLVSNYDHSHDHGGGGFTGGGSGNKDGNNPSNLNTNPDKTGSFPTEGIDHTFLSNKNPPTGSINKKPTNTQGNNNPTNIQGGNNPTITQGVNNPKNVQSDTKSTNANPTIIQIPKKAINNQNDNDTFTSNTIATNTISGTSSVTSITFPTPISLSSGVE
ncbi:hypothetical protein RclHR1_14070009 [Rhizophagus clarus]|uniref:Uncharacterized protein n=1 Tax=Rhizophagus clarus TaxID=94130 RepID=A0A2Z6QG46_9GLOM|nr:hypothetical protein RclHR1_14070009 [Rhizophagus clarus]